MGELSSIVVVFSARRSEITTAYRRCVRCYLYFTALQGRRRHYNRCVYVCARACDCKVSLYATHICFSDANSLIPVPHPPCIRLAYREFVSTQIYSRILFTRKCVFTGITVYIFKGMYTFPLAFYPRLVHLVSNPIPNTQLCNVTRN